MMGHFLTISAFTLTTDSEFWGAKQNLAYASHAYKTQNTPPQQMDLKSQAASTKTDTQKLGPRLLYN